MKIKHWTLVCIILGFLVFLMDFHINSIYLFSSYKALKLYFITLVVFSLILYLILRYKVLYFENFRVIWSRNTRITFWIVVITLFVAGLYPILLAFAKGVPIDHLNDEKTNEKTNLDIYKAMIGSGNVGIAITAFDTDLMRNNGYPFTYSERYLMVHLFNLDTIIEKNVKVDISVNHNLIEVLNKNDPYTPDQRVRLESFHEDILTEEGSTMIATVNKSLCNLSGSIDYQSLAAKYRVFYSVNCISTVCGLYPVTSYIQTKQSKEGKFIILGEGVGVSTDCPAKEVIPAPSLPSLYEYEYESQPMNGLEFLWNTN